MFQKDPVCCGGQLRLVRQQCDAFFFIRGLCNGLLKYVSVVICKKFYSLAAYVSFLFSTHSCFFCLLPTPLKVAFFACEIKRRFWILLCILLMLHSRNKCIWIARQAVILRTGYYRPRHLTLGKNFTKEHSWGYNFTGFIEEKEYSLQRQTNSLLSRLKDFYLGQKVLPPPFWRSYFMKDSWEASIIPC